MFVFLTADHFRFFLDGTGTPFTGFMDALLRATAAKIGISPADVHTNLRTNLPDGGIDTQIDNGSGRDDSEYLAGPSLWQFKARRFADITPGSIREDIQGESKQPARDLIIKGYAYRLCICEDGAPPDKKALQEKLNEYVREVNASAPPALILIPTDLAGWANRYPSIVARYLRLPVEKFRWHETWRPSAIGETPNFVPTEHYPEWAARVVSHLDWSQTPSDVALTLYGNAGVGKTRAIFEILDREPNQRELVLYTSDEQAAIEIATALTNDGMQTAILVADECLSRARFQLSGILRGNERRVRLITIDNALERTRTLEPELHVRKATQQETLKVLDANFESVSPDRRIRYTQIADGSLRFAIYMCRHDSEIQATGNLSSALRDAHSYYESRFSGSFGFDSKDREALEIVALVERVGYREDRGGELNALCSLVRKDPQETRERIERIRERMDFVASAGRFYYVTPAPVAMVAFESAWNRWIAPDPGRFLNGLPEDLVQPFQDRVASASPEVGAEVGRFFREWTIKHGARILESEADTRHLVALVVADPMSQVPLLRALVESASVEQLRSGEKTFLGSSRPRRLLVSLSEELAQFKEYFFDVEPILFRLALEEVEPSIGNNATNTWKGLFRILSSGTEVSFSQRFEILKRRGKGENATARRLVVSAAASAVDRQPIRLVGSPLFGSRLPPQDWRPQTFGEYYDDIEHCVRLLLSFTGDGDKHVAEDARTALFDAASHLLWAGYVEPVRKALARDVPEELRPRIRALVQESYSRLSWQERKSQRQDEDQNQNQNQEIKLALKDWLKDLESGTLHDLLVENVATEPWRHHFDEEEWKKRVEELAKDLYNDAAKFTTELRWLNSDQAKAAAEVGHFFGRLDGQGQRFLKEVIDAAVHQEADAFARGYVYGVTEQSPTDLSVLNRELDRVAGTNPKLAFYIMLPAGDAVHSFERALAMVGSREIGARLLSSLQMWVGNRKTTPVEAGQAVRLLLPIAESEDPSVVDTALDFVAYQINRVHDDEKIKILNEIFGSDLSDLWRLLELFVENPGHEEFWFARVLRTTVDLDPERGCDIASRMVVGKSFPMKDEGEKLLEELALVHPNEVMEAVGRRMTDETTKGEFFVRKFSFVSSLPLKVVTDWLQRTGVNGARSIARHLRPPYVDSNDQPVVPELTEFILTHFEDDDATFREFAIGVHSLQGYRGSYAAARTAEGLVARRFVTHPSRRVREWALFEIREAEHDAKVHGLREDEFNLNS